MSRQRRTWLICFGIFVGTLTGLCQVPWWVVIVYVAVSVRFIGWVISGVGEART